MSLTNTKCKQAKPDEKNYKLSDGKGLFLLVTAKGSKYWRLKYRYAHKEKLLALGVYPEIGLSEAREKTLSARKLLAEGRDPSAVKKAKKLSVLEASRNSFEVITWEWFAKEEGTWSPAHIKKQKGLIEKNLIPYLGNYPISNITSPILLSCLKRIEARGALETTRRSKQISGQIFRYAVVTGRTDRDPSIDLRGALKTPQTRNFPAITDPKKLAQLLLAIDGFDGTKTVASALKLAPLLFARPGELRQMEWSEIDFELAQWRLPEEKMKMRRTHIVPLCTQAIDILNDIHLFTGRHQFVFPSERTWKKPMSDNTLNAALRRMGYSKEEVTTHGFRATARTLLDEELKFAPHLIEHQLSHEVKDSLGRAYNRTTHLKERTEMMQDWGNYLYKIKTYIQIY